MFWWFFLSGFAVLWPRLVLAIPQRLHCLSAVRPCTGVLVLCRNFSLPSSHDTVYITFVCKKCSNSSERQPLRGWTWRWHVGGVCLVPASQPWDSLQPVQAPAEGLLLATQKILPTGGLSFTVYIPNLFCVQMSVVHRRIVLIKMFDQEIKSGWMEYLTLIVVGEQCRRKMRFQLTSFPQSLMATPELCSFKCCSKLQEVWSFLNSFCDSFFVQLFIW